MELKRYSKIIKKYPREFLLLQGTGCVHKKCTFCDYYRDVNENPFLINKPVIEKITGEFGILDIINSGSAMELDSLTIDLLRSKITEKKIKIIWFEAHWMYRNTFENFSKKFSGITVKYRGGIDTFNPKLRNSWNKAMPENITPLEFAKKFQSINLMVGIKGQKIEDIRKDIEIANKYFERFVVNVFTPNTTKTEQDLELIQDFKNEFSEILEKNPKAEVLFENTDFGVG